jgi:hypothetical protein
LALEHTKLMAEKEYLGLEARIRAAADEEDIEEQADEVVNEGHEHEPASSQARPLAQISRRSEFSHPTPSVVLGDQPSEPVSALDRPGSQRDLFGRLVVKWF